MENRPRRFLTGAVVALGLMVAAFVSPAIAGAKVAPGVVSDLSWGISNSDKQQEVAPMRDAGVSWTRITLGWRSLEPSKGSYSSYWLADLDAAVQAARSAGSKVILDALESPEWASGSTNKNAAPQNPQDFADFLSFIANRYQGEVQAYEIWNEENGSRFWPSGPNAAAYVQLLKAAYPAIKSADPSAQVVFGGLAWNDYHYLEAAYAAGAKGYFDVMAVHPYTCWTPDYYYWVDSNENWVASGTSPQPKGSRMTMYSYLGYREVHRSMVAAGDGDKPIWFTEFGWSSADTGSNCVVDEQTQASYLTRALQLANQDSYVQMALWYNFREDYWSTGSSYFDGGFGLIRKDFTPKPAYYAFRDYATGTSTAPPPDPAPTPPPSSTDSGSTSTGATDTGSTSTGTTTTSSPPTATTGGKKHRKKLAKKARRASARRG
jgi:cellulase (glycosyl hydrolase family 5)